MALHSKQEFAALCGLTTKKIAVYVQRHKVVYSGDYVNDAIEPNKSFLAKWIAKSPISEPPKKELRLPRAPTLKEMVFKEPVHRREIEPDTGEDDEGIPPINEFSGMEAKKMATQIKKMEKEIEKLTLGNQKARGQVVPVHLIDSLFLQERQSILIESKNILQDILTIFAKRRDLTSFERTEISSEFTDRLNEGMKRSAEATVNAVESIVTEFSIKRSKGERE
jgi:hypothetical protein